MNPTLCVVVQFPAGSRSYACANADVFTKDTLTITDAETEATLDDFGPDRWLAATAWDDHGVRYSFVNSQAGQVLDKWAAGAALVRQSVEGRHALVIR